MKRKKPTKKADSRTGTEGLSSPLVAVNYLLERINPDAMQKYLPETKAFAKAAKKGISWALLESGTTSKAGLRAAATVYITPDGFVAHFIVKDTST